MQMVSNLVAAGAATVLLVDGENIPQTMAGQIILKTRHFGRAMVARVYGDMTRLPDWEKTPSFEAVHTSCAKNSADMRICIDALDLAARGGVGRVVIASSDRDFTQLAQYLRAKGIEVVGLGMGHTAASFRFACSYFIELSTDAAEVQAMPKPAPSPKLKPQRPENATAPLAQQRVLDLVTAAGSAGIAIATLSTQLHAKYQIKVSDLGAKNWRAYFLAQSAQFVLDEKGVGSCVRLK